MQLAVCDIFELEKRIDVSSYDEYHKRVFGFLSEQLLLVWITARGLTVYESRVGISEEKAETKEFKLAIGQLIKMGQVTQARQMFYEILKVRPDIQLEHSDLKHEIPDIEQILYICELEETEWNTRYDGILEGTSGVDRTFKETKNAFGTGRMEKRGDGLLYGN